MTLSTKGLRQQNAVATVMLASPTLSPYAAAHAVRSRQQGLAPARCQVLEDSQQGVEAARRGGYADSERQQNPSVKN